MGVGGAYSQSISSIAWITSGITASSGGMREGGREELRWLDHSMAVSYQRKLSSSRSDLLPWLASLSYSGDCSHVGQPTPVHTGLGAGHSLGTSHNRGDDSLTVEYGSIRNLRCSYGTYFHVH